MKRLLTLLSILFLSLNLSAQIQTITIADLADTTNDVRLAGVLEDGSVIALDAICIDSNNCLWIKDTFGLKRAKMIVDSSMITIKIINNKKKVKIIKNININKRIVNVCGVKKFQSKFGKLFCETNFIDSVGVVTIYRDTTTQDTAIIIIEDPVNCQTIRASSKTDIIIVDRMDSTSAERTVIGPEDNTIVESVQPDNCAIVRGSSKSTVAAAEVWDSTSYTIAAVDTSGKSIEQRFDFENCKITYASNATGNTLMQKIDSNGISTGKVDSNGMGVVELVNPETSESCLQSTEPTGCVERKIVGNLTVTKQIFGGALMIDGPKAFRIDHPLDPDNKYLLHSCIEGPEQMNIYNGNVVTDMKGYAHIEMPEYFMALNVDFKYNLTVIGQTFARAVVWEEMDEDGKFVIRTDEPNVKVSWQVTGTRNDKKARENPFEVELTKEAFALKYGTN